MIEQIKPGADVRRDWRTINQSLDALDGLAGQDAGHRAAIAELTRRPRDIQRPATMFKVKSLLFTDGDIDQPGDYFIATKWDGETLGTDEFIIAKPAHLRHSVTTEIVDGETLTYTYQDENNRTATDTSAGTEKQVAYPRYMAHDAGVSDMVDRRSIVYACLVTNGTGVESGEEGSLETVSWLEISPARVWARKYDQS